MVQLEKLDENNWQEVSNLSVSKEQKEIFPIPNVYWIGISRYEEHTTLYAIKNENNNVGLVGIGYDEDGISGYINPLMIDERYQGKGYSKKAVECAIHLLKAEYSVKEIHMGHRKTNVIAGTLYEKFNFKIVGEDEQDYFRCLVLE